MQLDTLPRETCSASTTYYVTDDTNGRWVKFRNTPTFFIRHEDRWRKKHNHFLEVGRNMQGAYHYWKINKMQFWEKFYITVKLGLPPVVVLFGQSIDLQKDKGW